MKKILLIVFALTFGTLKAQDIQILDSLNNVVNGDTLSITGVIDGSNPNYLIEYKYIQVKNNSNFTAEVYVLREEGTIVQPGTADLLCWGGLCENGTPAGSEPRNISMLYETMSPGDSVIGGGLGFAGYYQPNGKAGDTYYTYTFFDSLHQIAPASFVLKFTAKYAVGLKENVKKQKVSISPNPAVSQFNLKYDLNGNYAQRSIEVLDLVGKTVMTKNVSANSGNEVVDIENLRAGIYFVRIKADGEYTASQKLIVR